MGSAASTPFQRDSSLGAASFQSDDDELSRISAYDSIFDGVPSKKSFASHKQLSDLRSALRCRTGAALEKAVDSLVAFSSCKENLTLLCSSELDLMPHVVSNIPNCMGCINIIANVAVLPQNHAYLLSAEVGLMSYIMSKTKVVNFDDLDIIWILTNLCETLKEENINMFLSFDLLPIVVKRLLHSTFEDLINGFDSWVLTLLESLSYHPAAAARLKELNVVPRLIDLMKYPGNAGVKASITVFNILGREEARCIHSLGSTLQRLMILFKATLTPSSEEDAEQCRRFVPDYYFGGIKLRSICGAIRSLSISDVNKPILVKMGVLGLLIQTLNMFTSDATALAFGSEKSVGGGGDDIETAELVIETLLQLSFGFHTDIVLVEAYVWACEHCITDILSVCCDPTASCNLSATAMSNAACLLSLLSSTVNEAGQYRASVKGVTVEPHLQQGKNGVVLSYSADDVNCSLIHNLTSELALLGHTADGGAVEDNFDLAVSSIESAHTVIVFVSPQYKQSAQCRLASQKISQRRLVNPALKVLYVVTSIHYQADGWLNSLMGSSVCFPLWDENTVKSTACCLHESLGCCRCCSEDNSVINLDRSFSTVSASTASLSLVSPRHAAIDGIIPH